MGERVGIIIIDILGRWGCHTLLDIELYTMTVSCITLMRLIITHTHASTITVVNIIL